jgi:hypothetical protein
MFKVGDKIICINMGSGDRLLNGQQYIVVKVYSSGRFMDIVRWDKPDQVIRETTIDRFKMFEAKKLRRVMPDWF